jgi:hypothetical protein
MFKVSLFALAATIVIAATGRDAAALPAFARKYHTSCQTCHTVFPKLTPFGEAFRRNGYRWPGVDSDAVKAEPVEMGTDAQKKTFPDSVWPGTVSPFPAFALGFNGQAFINPDSSSSAAAGDNGVRFNLDTLIQEAHLWAAGSVDDSITYYSETTFSRIDGLNVERAALYLGDLVGPQHAVNAVVGRFPAQLTSFGPHSSYLADTELPAVLVTGLYGATSDPFDFTDNHNGAEINGVIAGRFDYSAGLVAGTNVDFRTSSNVYAHVGVKLGGATLDGEGSGSTDIDKEHAVTLDGYFYRSTSHFTDANMAEIKNVATVAGAAVRAQWAKWELNSGVYFEHDDQAIAGGPTLSTIDHFDEGSYLLYPWLALALRLDYVQVTPSGGDTVSDVAITPGFVALVRPNIRVIATMPIERASGAPPAGWGNAAGFFAAPATATSTLGPEVESIVLTLWAAF